MEQITCIDPVKTLPYELDVQIGSNLDLRTLVALSRVSKDWRSFWQSDVHFQRRPDVNRVITIAYRLVSPDKPPLTRSLQFLKLAIKIHKEAFRKVSEQLPLTKAAFDRDAREVLRDAYEALNAAFTQTDREKAFIQIKQLAAASSVMRCFGLLNETHRVSSFSFICAVRKQVQQRQTPLSRNCSLALLRMLLKQDPSPETSADLKEVLALLDGYRIVRHADIVRRADASASTSQLQDGSEEPPRKWRKIG